MLNPISFRPGPVTFWTTVVYMALGIPLVVINENPRPAPAATPFAPINLTEAWLDLAEITRAYHPYNSQNNDVVRAWLLQRIGEILDQNGASWSTQTLGPSAAGSSSDHPPSAVAAKVVVFNDLASNLTSSISVSVGTSAGHASRAGQAAYFEGPNIYTYIRGSQDDPGDFWKTDTFRDARRNENGLTLVNAHFDSVATGFGATDDGMGVATVLQLIKYYSYPGHQPKRGIVLLLNDDEENGLQGARAFGQSPLAPFCHTFVNLEGAGAGGRCVLFRSTDAEVTAAYRKVTDPFGTVLFSDAFKRGFVRSDTDYSVFHNIYGQRGLDISFYKPRSSYHTNWDDVSHASRASLWHMISSAVATVGELSSDTGRTFVGPRPDGVRRKVANGSPTDGVWFDLFGRGFVLFGLRGMFAWSLAVLIAGPLILILVTYILHKLDKYYFFSSSVRTYEQPDYEIVAVGGMKGFFRFPLALVFAGALSVGVALLLHKVNPFVIYTYRYTVWATVVSLFYFVFWAIMRGSNFARPSALHRGYVNIWLFILGWAVLVLVAALEDRLRIGAGYIFVFLETAILVSTFLSLCEQFALPKKTAWGQQVREDHAARDRSAGQHQDSILSHLQSVPHAEASASAPTSLPAIPHHASLSASSGDGACSSEPAGSKAAAAKPPPSDGESASDADDSHEHAPLLGGDATSDVRTTFATTYRRSITALVQGAKKASEDGDGPYEHEQAWSGNLPSWIWFFQFMLLGPFTIILAAQTGLVLVDATHQTGADGSSLLTPYLVVVLFTVLLLLPLTPFIHRVTHHIPVFLLVVFIATLAFNLVVFPFSDTSRYKVYFLQTVDLDTGSTAVHFAGLDPYVQRVIADMPSASGRDITCAPGRRKELIDCSYDGSAVMPNPGGGPPYCNASSLSSPTAHHTTTNLTDLVTVNITRGPGNSARLEVDVVNSRACFLQFNKPLLAFSVVGGSGWDDRFGPYPEGGCDFIKMSRWNRDKKWIVDIEWDDGSGPYQGDDGNRDGEDQAPLLSNIDLKMTRKRNSLQPSSTLEGTAIGTWSDANTPGVIPALDEALKFTPTWVAVTKMDAGLVEGRKRFSI